MCVAAFVRWKMFNLGNSEHKQIIPVTETGIVWRPPLSAGSDAALKRRAKIYLEPIFSAIQTSTF